MNCLDNLKTCIFLDGSARRRSFVDAIDRSLFNLPLNNQTQIITPWMSNLESVATEIGRSSFPVRIVVDEITPPPEVSRTSDTLSVAIETDPSNWRGSAGVLHDVTRGDDKEDFALVISGVQVLLSPLWNLIEEMAEADADITLLADPDGSSVGITLIRCGCLRDIAPIGFIDFKEQALPRLAARHVVRVVQARKPTAMPVRSRETYIAALRHWHQQHSRNELSSSGRVEDCWPAFSVVEQGAVIGSDVELLDSVVLSGAAIGSGTSVVQSVVCPGQRIGPNETVIRSLVGSEPVQTM